MNDDEEAPAWTLAEHLTAGRIAIAQIEGERTDGSEPICHHFSNVGSVDAMSVGIRETYRYLEPRIASLGLEFLSDRLEAWETERPRAQWLERRVPDMFEMASIAGLEYQGWTWEPAGRQPIGASNLLVINNRTPPT